MTNLAPAANSRRHDIDALRALAFALLILYHVGMYYVADWGWHVKSAHLSEALQLPMLLLNQWRMPLIFMVSGIAISFVIGKYSLARLARRRSLRLLLPLAFGMAVIVPPQAYYQALSNGVIEPGYGAFLWRYFSFGGWPEGAFDGSDIGITWNHLWYLPYLLAYTLVLIAVIALLGSRRNSLLLAARRLRGWALVVVPTLPLLVYGLILFPLFGGVSHDFISDGYAHAMYFTIFVYGYILGRDGALWAQIARLRWVLLALAALSFCSYLALNEIIPEQRSSAENLLQLAVIYLNRWIWLLLVLGWAHRVLNRPMRWLPYANRAVYPWYVLHQTITVVAGYQLARLGLGPVVEPTLLIAITIAGCAAGFEVIRRVSWLQPLFGVSPIPAPAEDSASPGPAASTTAA